MLGVVTLLALTVLTGDDASAPAVTPTAIALTTIDAGTPASPAPIQTETPATPSPVATAVIHDPDVDQWGDVVDSVSEDPSAQMFRVTQARAGFIDDQSIDEAPGVAWTAQLADQNFSVPVTDGRELFVGGQSGVLTCFDRESGELLWEFEAGDAISSSPAVAGNSVFVGSFDGNFYAIDLDNGRRDWRFETSEPIHSSPAVDGQVVYFGGFDHVVYALSRIDGTLAWSAITGGEIESSPAIAGDAVYIGSNDGYLYALDRLTGHRLWRVDTGSAVKSTPAVVEDRVFVANAGGKVLALAIADGEVLWEFEAGSGIEYSSPAIENNTVVIGSEAGIIFGIRSDNGRERWRVETENEVRASATIVDRVVYIGGYDQNLYAIALNTGDVLWTSDRGGVVGSPVFSNGVLYLSLSSGEIQALRAE